ncbi:MAG: hypothetical protein C0482_10460 [Gordonia sp.]|nr:hypothetical protein [Gordonia sp. (in: high G+C Gram-positive bacteria)]
MIKSLDSAFVPNSTGSAGSFLPGEPTLGDPPVGSLGQPPQQQSGKVVLKRAYSQFVLREKTYPPSWIPHRAADYVRGKVLQRVPRSESQFGHDDKVRILYPLHDERDFQVAVRERHAVPQVHLLAYISSTLPAGYHLYVKPHPEHLAAHHSIRWRHLTERPNVHFLPAGMKGGAAIESADVVLTLASSMGFEALSAGKPVVCYGSPFYSERGLTHDVKDPRTISRVLQESIGVVPDSGKVKELHDEILKWSWHGSFTPLVTSEDNMARLMTALNDVRAQL